VQRGEAVTALSVHKLCSSLTLSLSRLAMVQMEQSLKLDQLRDQVMSAEGIEEKVEGNERLM